MIAPGFFKTMGTRIIAGRDFTWTDLYEKRHVAMVSENLARELWGDPRAALGKRIRVGTTDAWREIVGVVEDVYDNGAREGAHHGVLAGPDELALWGQHGFVQP